MDERVQTIGRVPIRGRDHVRIQTVKRYYYTWGANRWVFGPTSIDVYSFLRTRREHHVLTIGTVRIRGGNRVLTIAKVPIRGDKRYTVLSIVRSMGTK